ncbi:MAG: FAD-binding protein [Acidobacteria bacterium]|nr:FAD-binding protein [Acidobacteriota bacterium]
MPVRQPGPVGRGWKASGSVDAQGLSSALRRHLRGEVRFDQGSRALYATDGSNYRQVPIGVVVPRDVEDVIASVALAREFAAPVLCRGAGTSLAGQSTNVALVIDMSKYLNRILDINPHQGFAIVEPGVVLDDLRREAEKYHLTFGPDPATHDRCTLGGMIGNNSCGVHSVMAGKTDDNIEELEILTYDGLRMQVGAIGGEELQQVTHESSRRGEIYGQLAAIMAAYGDQIRQRYPRIPRRVSGYNLNYLLPENGFHVARALVGSEGTCVTVLGAKCRLVNSPPYRTLVVLAYPDIYTCGDQVPEVMSHGPIGLEGIDEFLVEFTRRKNLNSEGLSLLPQGNGWLLVEFGGETQREADARAGKMVASLDQSSRPPQVRLYSDSRAARKVWEIREASLGASSHVPGEPLSWEGWEDSAVPPEKLGSYLRALRKLMNAYAYSGVLYGHFGHGCIHTRISFDLESKAGIAKFRSFLEEAADLVVSYGGSLSGEHGDGLARSELLPKMFGPELIEAFRLFKAAWDPEAKMNPGVLVEPHRLDENLRLGEGYQPWAPETHFHYAEDHGSLARATLRCVGVGKCRRMEGGLMCPSYRVTREEEHSTRGRAHLLWEMTRREIIRGGWQDEHVRESLELCLSCKGCKSDCPVGVDVATYKSEFLAHYYEGRRRPLYAYAFGNVDLCAQLASLAPGLSNLATQLPLVSDLAKLFLGIAPERRIPAFAPITFRRWFARHQPAHADGPPVILWADTFTNYFSPDRAIAALEVLEAAGFRVLVPGENLCCGRALYDFGMLARAKDLLLLVLDAMAPYIDAGIPLVALEPSCAAVFRDELGNLFPQDERARRLSAETYLLSEFLVQCAPRFELPRLERKAIVHGHCHQKSIMTMKDEEALLGRMGIDFSAPAPGCCGMAGSFGLEKSKYQISLGIAELELLPAIRRASPETLIIADGFSCREQVAQLTDRHALHLAEVIQMALSKGPKSVAEPYPEGERVGAHQKSVRRSMLRAGSVVAGLVIAGGLLWSSGRNRG